MQQCGRREAVVSSYPLRVGVGPRQRLASVVPMGVAGRGPLVRPDIPPPGLSVFGEDSGSILLPRLKSLFFFFFSQYIFF